VSKLNLTFVRTGIAGEIQDEDWIAERIKDWIAERIKDNGNEMGGVHRVWLVAIANAAQQAAQQIMEGY
jgi:hypothetical protein